MYLTDDSLGDRVTRLARPSAATHVVRVVCVVFGVPLPYTFTFSSWSTLLHMVLCDYTSFLPVRPDAISDISDAL